MEIKLKCKCGATFEAQMTNNVSEVLRHAEQWQDRHAACYEKENTNKQDGKYGDER